MQINVFSKICRTFLETDLCSKYFCAKLIIFLPFGLFFKIVKYFDDDNG
jgi:hypothetical protein